MVRQLTRWFLSSPGAQLVAGAIVLALAFPSTPIGTWGWMICAAALGVGVSAWWPHLPAAIRKPPVRIATALVLLVIAVVAIASFWDVLSERPDWQMGDWGPQRAVLARIMPSLPGLDVPVWNHVVSTGDAPLELYPALTYLVTGHFAWLFGLQNDLPLAFMIVATLVHLGLALTTTAVAIRVSSRPVALVIGLFWLFDTGAVSHGGTIGLYHWGLLHSAFAHVFSMIAALGILAALARPRIGASITIWIATAISVAAHPVALITSAAYVIALGAVALLAGDVPPRRALAAIGHVVLGVALGATVWLPASERLLAYGQHFPNELYDTVKFVQVVMSATVPTSAYAPIIFAGHLGALTGMWTRRAAVIFVSIVAIVLVFGIAEAPYLAFGLAPGKSVARLGAIRLLMLARPFVFAAGAYAIHALIAAARTRWAGARPRARAIAAAVLGVLAVCAARVVPEYYRAESFRAVDEARQFAPDHEGREALVQWAERQMQEVGPTRMARALFEEDTHEQYHLTAETGLPTLHMGAIPDLMLRDRMESTDPESLRRFDVRWAIAIGHAPTLGDPATQKVVGDFYIQDITGWDGQFARIERGTGTVTVARLDDRAVVIDVDAHEPVLVALGTGYYPRWRATHETGADEPVYALPGTANGTLHVVSAWVAPGRTTFTCDGRLPSDGDGRVLSLLAAALALAGVIVWRRPRLRIAALRRVARWRARAPAIARRTAEYGVPAVLAVLVVRGCMIDRGRTQAVMVGSGVLSEAKVEARFGADPWQTCPYAAISGLYRCDDLVTVSDGSTSLLNDGQPGWPFTTPGIVAIADQPDVEVRITRDVHLIGHYWAASDAMTASIELGNDRERPIGALEQFDLADRGREPAIIHMEVTGTESFSMVAEETLIPPQQLSEPPPPAAAPPRVSAIVR